MTALSPTAAVETAADVVVLSTGDVRVPLHPEHPESPAAPRRADQPYRAPAGDTALRERIAAYATEPGGEAVPPDAIVVTPGARQAIFLVLRAMTRERPEVLLPVPHWTSYPELIAMAGGRTVRVPGPVGDGTLDVAALEALRTERTGALVINSPRNPDGAVVPAGSLRRAVDWAAEHGIGVLFDQVYRGVSLGAEPAPSITSLHPRLPGHTALVDGLTKSHALAGLRLGWAVLPPGLRAPVVAAASHLIGGAAGPAQDAALVALDGGTPARVVRALTANLDRATAELAGTPGLECARPTDGIFLFPDLRGWLRSDAPDEARRDLAGWLREHHRVAVVDGAGFGAPGHVRLSFALPEAQLLEGVRRLRKAVEGSRR
ncbi:aminotransferase class I/II-fold pyridoxal phosphate-dependent enzyme [Streptomyces sp. NBC_01511]|uniref:pyridoxal phosphate-dependent aminotransferase n=1 Tax=unclassified Streptomyces TaxID=2593676 RepID=UPI00386A3D9C